MLEIFLQNSSGERERTDYFTITVMQQLMDKGHYCDMFPADTQKNSDPAPDSLQVNRRQKVAA